MRATNLLSDAWHTASLPVGDDGRFVVIRTLALGRISTALSPASLALHIERVTRDAMSGAAFYDLAQAEDAPAVVFQSRGDAILALARLHAGGGRANHWFWPAVLPAWDPAESRAHRWTLLLAAAHALPEAAIVVAAMVDAAIGAGAEEELYRVVEPGAGAAFLRAAGWSDVEPGSSWHSVRRVRLPRAEVIERWQRRSTVDDDRVVWLATMLAVHDSRTLAGDPRLPQTIASTIREWRADQRWLDTEPLPRRRERSVPVDPGTAPTSHTRLKEEPFASDEARIQPHAGNIEEETQWGARSPHAGLLLVVPLLARLGFSEYLRQHPQLLHQGFPYGLLAFIGQRAGLAIDDPLAVVFESESEPLSGDGPGVLGMPEPARDVLSVPPPRLAIDSPYVAWLTTVRRFCRRQLRMGLLTLIRRPGRVHVSRTHLEGQFELTTADVRIRRQALDIDPGWVPWLGRVVRYHYVR
jgi:hypothetical protein